MKSEAMIPVKKLTLRKFLLVAPILVLPFIILLLWAFAFVGGAYGGNQASLTKHGMNLNLPSATPPSDSNWNKLKYYELAEKEAQKREQQLRNDPFIKNTDSNEQEFISMENVSEAALAEKIFGKPDVETYTDDAKRDPNEIKVYKRLSKLRQELSKEPEPQTTTDPTPTPSYTPEISQLESAMQQMQSSGQDPELTQLDQMLDKIIAIQNPDKVKQQLRQASEKNKGQVFAVMAGNDKLEASTLGLSTISNDEKDNNGFFSIDNADSSTSGITAINAVVHQTQTLVNGATVKLRLTDDIFINGVLIPKATFVYGVANLNGERLKITINGFRYKSRLLPVQLTVYDLDGLEGIRVPGAISREVMQQGTDRGLQGLGFSTVSPSVGMQAASLGVEAAKSF
ncbi:conjugative transposon protein TraM [Niabella ginsengisoli]|uniref:Conjugative transposon protein TraM n=1 Tax=Niabella ginsengisoli TaxID=522298 RepID=A0ABS9SHT3_9BACT|nr:conjugative transposon protein TraM [Niabella ginsengisoli]MCH5597929.1 conjugative transposon protein TraM [Niabella ginsengisoli]